MEGIFSAVNPRTPRRIQIFPGLLLQPHLDIPFRIGNLRLWRTTHGSTDDGKVDPGVFELLTKYLMFDIILAQLLTGHGMFSGGKELGRCPETRNKRFSHALLRLLFDNFINCNRVVGVKPEGKLAVVG